MGGSFRTAIAMLALLLVFLLGADAWIHRARGSLHALRIFRNKEEMNGILPDGK